MNLVSTWWFSGIYMVVLLAQVVLTMFICIMYNAQFAWQSTEVSAVPSASLHARQKARNVIMGKTYLGLCNGRMHTYIHTYTNTRMYVGLHIRCSLPSPSPSLTTTAFARRPFRSGLMIAAVASVFFFPGRRRGPSSPLPRPRRPRRTRWRRRRPRRRC